MKQDICKAVAKRGYITENEINCFKSRMNRGDDSANYDDLFQNYGVMISPEQTAKGLSWLLNQWKTPRGIERKNNPFGAREISTLENFDHFELVDFYNAGSWRPFYLPVYRVVGAAGYPDFEYYVNGGQLIITA